MKDIKRRSFLKSIGGGIVALFVGVPKAKAVIKKPLESDIYSPNNPNSKVRWRKYETLEPSTKPLFDDLDDWPSGLPGGGLNEEMLGDKPWTDAQKKILADLKEDELVYKFLETQLKNKPILSICAGTQDINGVKYKYVCFGTDSAHAVNCENGGKDYLIWKRVDGEYIHYSV